MSRPLRLSHWIPLFYAYASCILGPAGLSSRCGLLSTKITFGRGSLAYWAEDQEVFRHTQCMFFFLSLKYFTVYYFDVSSDLANIKLFLLVCNHTENMKQFSLNKFDRCFILA